MDFIKKLVPEYTITVERQRGSSYTIVAKRSWFGKDIVKTVTAKEAQASGMNLLEL